MNSLYLGDEVPIFSLQYEKDKYSEKTPEDYPEEGSEKYQELKKFSSEVELILLTINDREYHAAAIYMENLSDKFDQAVFVPGLGNTVVGMFARTKTVLIQSKVGSYCDKFVRHASNNFPNAQFVIAVGVCYAFDCSKYQLGDVLVSEQICDLLNSKFEDGKILHRGPTVNVVDKLSRFFMDLTFDFKVTDKRQCKVYSGKIASLPILFNDKERREAVRACVTELIGGEMEGSTLVQKFDDKEDPIKGVIVIKGVVDYADGSKKDEWQFTAAMAAVRYTHLKLKRAGSLKVSRFNLQHIIFTVEPLRTALGPSMCIQE